MSSRLSLAALVVASVSAAALSALAQTAQNPKAPDPQRPPTFRTEANFVRVDVFATLKGVPVRDLRLEDFAVLEDGVPQKLATFEHVHVNAGMPQEVRAEPNTIQQSRDALKNPRARVFVLFLDVDNVTIHGSWNVREPLVRMVDQLLGPEDLVGIMTPKMAASDVVFARKTQVLAGGLRDRWPWGERHTLAEDETEFGYRACYPASFQADVVSEMIARRRERMSLDALYELVTWLRDEREERKAVVTISEGWLLYGRNPDLTRPRRDPVTGRQEPIPGPEPIGTGPDGRIRIGNQNGETAFRKSDCDISRHSMSEMDNDRYFRDIIEAANRSNASFYTVDPRGLAVWDSPIGPAKPPPPSVDAARLRTRVDNLRILAANTDGMAMVSSNDLDKSLRRIAEDLTSYYLLGYYSTNTRLDGRYRTLRVNVTRPGVDVRARRGYKAATEKEVKMAREAAATPEPAGIVTARDALSSLGRIRADALLATHAVAVNGAGTMVWIAGEFPRPAADAMTGIITVSTLGATNSAEVKVAAGQRTFMTSVPLKVPAAGPVDIRLRFPQPGGGAPMTDGLRVDAASGPLPSPMLFRRGPATGNRDEPAGSLQFSRSERITFRVPLADDVSLSGARVLDRNGKQIDLPVTLAGVAGPPSDPALRAQRWAAAELVLAPLAAGDYLVELSARVGVTEHKVLTPFRVTSR